MSSKGEREKRKALLLSQIQQQRLDLSASRRDWLETTGAYDRGWNTVLSLRSWALVGSSVMVSGPSVILICWYAGRNAAWVSGAPGAW